MEERIVRPSTIVLQLLILIFAVCLIWFTFVYYPKIVKERSFALTFTPFAPKVVATTDSFPIQTDSYRITYEKASGLYYTVVEGKTLNSFVENKNAAQLALKNALSTESLCNQKIIYASSAGLSLSSEFTTTSNCN